MRSLHLYEDIYDGEDMIPVCKVVSDYICWGTLMLDRLWKEMYVFLVV